MQHHLVNYERELAIARQELNSLKDGLEEVPEDDLHASLYKNIHPAQRRIFTKRLKAIGKVKSLQSSIDFVNYQLRKKQIIPQSGVVPVASTGSGQIDVRDQVVSDGAGLDIFLHSVGETKDTSAGQQEAQGVEDYLARPVVIHSASHAVGTKVSMIIPVWEYLTNEPSVRAKLRNFAYLRSKLHVRIAVSGTSFHAGRLMVSYQPFADWNPILGDLTSLATSSANYRPVLLNYLSQAAGAVSMNINDNKPVELEIPFIFPRPMARLFTGSSALAAATPYPDMTTMGSLYVYSINDVAASGTADTPIYIQIYAWMTDVQLGTSTATQTVITTESGELKTGPIQKIASRMVKVSNALAHVPYLKPYAVASEMVFSGVRYIATHLGWSRPVVLTPPTVMVQRSHANTAITVGEDTSYRVVLDPQQELSNAAMYSGTDEDEMMISHIASRPSYLKTVTWDSTDTPLSDLLFNCYVHPNLVTDFEAIPKRIHQPTAMAFAVAPFHFWRGDIVYRFEIVASGFHRGKIAVVYEPNPSQLGLTAVAPQINKQYVQIVDIQDTNIFEVKVNWASARNWLSNISPSTTKQVVDNPLLPSFSPDTYNGWIGVYPFTELQSPDGSGVSINVYVYSPDLQVNGLTKLNMPTERSFVIPESGIYPATEYKQVDLNESTASATNICNEHFGEQPLSFRALLKRYVTTRQFTITSAVATNKTLRQTFNIYPPNNMARGTSFSRFDLFSYLRYAYLGVRGGMRVLIRTNYNPFPAGFTASKLGLMPPTSSTTETLTFDDTIYNDSTLEGAVQFASNTAPQPQAELPFYTNNSWVFAPNDDLLDNSSLSTFEQTWFRQGYYACDSATATFSGTTNRLFLDQAVGEDFSFIKFLGAPWYSTTA